MQAKLNSNWRCVLLRRILLTLTVALIAGVAAPEEQTRDSVFRLTLENGLRVVIIRDPLAPVVTVEENYLAGGNETPTGFPGMAHAQEHMAFRGCAGLSADRSPRSTRNLEAIERGYAAEHTSISSRCPPRTWKSRSASTRRACRSSGSEEQWAEERGAIEQEVARDLSNPTYKFFTRLNQDLFAGTPYAHDALGTKASFDATTGAMLKKFYQDWYAPNNAILVIAGDIDPTAAMAKVKQLYGPIKRQTAAAQPEINLPPVKAEVLP